MFDKNFIDSPPKSRTPSPLIIRKKNRVKSPTPSPPKSPLFYTPQKSPSKSLSKSPLFYTPQKSPSPKKMNKYDKNQKNKNLLNAYDFFRNSNIDIVMLDKNYKYTNKLRNGPEIDRILFLYDEVRTYPYIVDAYNYLIRHRIDIDNIYNVYQKDPILRELQSEKQQIYYIYQDLVTKMNEKKQLATMWSKKIGWKAFLRLMDKYADERNMIRHNNQLSKDEQNDMELVMMYEREVR